MVHPEPVAWLHRVDVLSSQPTMGSEDPDLHSISIWHSYLVQALSEGESLLQSSNAYKPIRMRNALWEVLWTLHSIALTQINTSYCLQQLCLVPRDRPITANFARWLGQGRQTADKSALGEALKHGPYARLPPTAPTNFQPPFDEAGYE